MRKLSLASATLGMVLLASLAHAADSYYQKTLREKNIEPTVAGLNEYLQGLHPTDAQRARAAELIQQLGDSTSFAAREDAMTKLLVLPVLPNESLIAASQGEDPEIRWRAKHVLAVGKPESEKVLFAAFKTIEEAKLQGTAPEVLHAILVCDKPHLRFAAREAVKAAATPEDAALLRRELNNENLDIRIAAIGALGQALGDDAAEDLEPLLDDANDRIRLAAAQAVANYGGRKSLPALTDLLGSNDTQVRALSSATLRALTGQQFAFAAYDKPERRNAAIAKWKAWVATDGQTADLKFPLRAFGGNVSYLAGNTLLAYGYRNKVAELDPTGKEIWNFTNVSGAWMAEKLANGNVLIAAYQNNRVIEVDPNGNIVWFYPNSNCLSARPLQNGNVLIAEIAGRKVVEVDRDKNVVWKYESNSSSCYDAHRLVNGNTVIVLNNEIIEVTPAGETAWQYPLNGSHGMQPLDNGNMLLCDSSRNRVIEVTRDKNIVWEVAENYPADVFRLPNGNTLITGSNRFVEVTPDKDVVWSLTGCSYGSARK